MNAVVKLKRQETEIYAAQNDTKNKKVASFENVISINAVVKVKLQDLLKNNNNKTTRNRK